MSLILKEARILFSFFKIQAYLYLSAPLKLLKQVYNYTHVRLNVRQISGIAAGLLFLLQRNSQLCNNKFLTVCNGIERVNTHYHLSCTYYATFWNTYYILDPLVRFFLFCSFTGVTLVNHII